MLLLLLICYELLFLSSLILRYFLFHYIVVCSVCVSFSSFICFTLLMVSFCLVHSNQFVTWNEYLCFLFCLVFHLFIRKFVGVFSLSSYVAYFFFFCLFSLWLPSKLFWVSCAYLCQLILFFSWPFRDENAIETVGGWFNVTPRNSRMDSSYNWHAHNSN